MDGADREAALHFTQSTRHIPNAFSDGCGQIPNNPLVAAAFAAVFKGGSKARSLINGWEADENGRLRYRHIGRRGGEISVYFDDSNPEGSTSHSPLAKQISCIESLNPLTADVLFAILAQLCEKSSGNRTFYPLSTPVLISTNAILKYKNIQRWGWERSDLRRRIKQELELIRQLRFDIIQFPSWDPGIKSWNHKGVSAIGDKIVDLVDFDEITMVLDNREKLVDAMWSARVGHWSRWWLNTQAKVWLGEIPIDLLELDHRANRGAANLAKKIGLGTTVLLEALKSRSYIERRVDHLLEAIGELPIKEARDSHWAGRTRDRFDEALIRLQEAGIFAKVEWPKGDGPGDLDRNKGWVNRWLESKIKIHRRNAVVREEQPGAKQGRQWSPKRRKSRNGSAKMDAGLSGRAIRKRRIEESLTQEQLARKLNISNAYLSKIENQKVPITKDVMQRLSEYLTLSAK